MLRGKILRQVSRTELFEKPARSIGTKCVVCDLGTILGTAYSLMLSAVSLDDRQARRFYVCKNLADMEKIILYCRYDYATRVPEQNIIYSITKNKYGLWCTPWGLAFAQSSENRNF